MSTTHTYLIPMPPNARPQHHIHEVVALPELAKHLDPKIDMDEPLPKNYQQRSPRKSYLSIQRGMGVITNANRIDNHYLNPRRTGWLLYNNQVENGGFPWIWHWDLMAYGKRSRSDQRKDAIHLVRVVWKFDLKYHDTEQSQGINITGLLGRR